MRPIVTGFFAFAVIFFGGCLSAQVSGPRAGEPQLPPQAGGISPGPSYGTTASGVTGQSLFFGGVPSGQPTPEEIFLSLTEALERGLKNNLGALLSEQGRRAAQGARWRLLSDLLPNLTTRTTESTQQVNLAAFGFSGFPGVPQIIGPFSIFDARVLLSQPVLDFRAIHNARAGSENVKAADYSYQDARDVVVLVVANLYLQAIAGASRIDAARAQLKTAQALYNQAADLKKAGMVPAIEVLRAQVELQSQHQRLIFFENEFEKQKLNLARAIGLPQGQQFHLTDQITYSPLPPIAWEESLQRAYEARSDYQGAIARVRAAESARKAASGGRLPSLSFHSDYGTIGPSIGDSHGTFTLAGSLTIPIFEGGRVRSEILEAEAALQQRRAEMADLRSRIELELRTAFMDLKAAGEQVDVARSALQLAGQQMEQARDRFQAGVVSNLEVVQAQEALATTNENYVSSLFAYNTAKASLARALGGAEKSVRQFLLGGNP
jgi:outer membrane protein TolC